MTSDQKKDTEFGRHGYKDRGDQPVLNPDKKRKPRLWEGTNLLLIASKAQDKPQVKVEEPRGTGHGPAAAEHLQGDVFLMSASGEEAEGEKSEARTQAIEIAAERSANAKKQGEENWLPVLGMVEREAMTMKQGAPPFC